MKQFLYITCVCSFIISLSALFAKKQDIDTYNITIAVLATLVTIALCWQIYNAIDVNQKVRDIHHIARRTAQVENDLYNHTVIALIMYIEAIDIDRRINNTEETVDKLIAAIEEGLKGKYSYPIDSSIDYLYKMSNREYPLMIYKGKRNEYVKILSKIYNDNISKIIINLNKAIEV